MLISPLTPLSSSSVLDFSQLDETNLRHLFWHALQADSQTWEAEDFGFCLNDYGVSRGTNGEYQKRVGLVVMRLTKGIHLDATLTTPTLNRVAEKQSGALAVFKSVLPKGMMKLLHLAELRHPVSSGFYTVEEYESFLKGNSSYAIPSEVSKV